MAESAGLTFRSDGGVGMSGGSDRTVRAIALCTSCAAASMLRSRSNCSEMLVDPIELLELIDAIPEIVANCFSSGVATDAAIVSGSAPGRFALTCSVGKSTAGRSLTGSDRYPITPKMTIASCSSVVATGRRMKTAEGCTWIPATSADRRP
jgi:hypothetical protein